MILVKESELKEEELYKDTDMKKVCFLSNKKGFRASTLLSWTKVFSHVKPFILKALDIL